ncbi:MAG: hypothetical protein AB1465_04615 [Patescibacteria group bacterium]
MKLKIFVRWDKSHDDAGGRVEVQAGKFGGELGTEWLESFTVWSRQCGNNDRVYGYCMALVDMLQYQGHEVIWPHCLSGHVSYNRERED